MNIKLKDIANELGISISTVSRALNPDTAHLVKPVTLSKIKFAMDKLGYNSTFLPEDPNKKKAIGVIVSSRNTIPLQLSAQICAYLEKYIATTECYIKYNLVEEQTPTDRLYEEINTRHVDGVIIIGPINYKLYEYLKLNIKHLIYIGVNKVFDEIDNVTGNAYNEITDLFEHFYSLGHRKIAYIGITHLPSINSTHNFFLSYKANVEAKGTELIYQSTTDTIEDGYSVMYKMLTSQIYPEAVICSSSNIAIGVMRAAHENNLKIPDQLAISSMDNIRVSRYLIPSLTSAHISLKDLTRFGVDVLLDKINGVSNKLIHLTIPHSLVIRESCGYNAMRQHNIESTK